MSRCLGDPSRAMSKVDTAGGKVAGTRFLPVIPSLSERVSLSRSSHLSGCFSGPYFLPSPSWCFGISVFPFPSVSFSRAASSSLSLSVWTCRILMTTQSDGPDSSQFLHEESSQRGKGTCPRPRSWSRTFLLSQVVPTMRCPVCFFATTSVPKYPPPSIFRAF